MARSKLIGGWKFIPLSPEACKIEFHLDFEFTNKLIEMAFGLDLQRAGR